MLCNTSTINSNNSFFPVNCFMYVRGSKYTDSLIKKTKKNNI